MAMKTNECYKCGNEAKPTEFGVVHNLCEDCADDFTNWFEAELAKLDKETK